MCLLKWLEDITERLCDFGEVIDDGLFAVLVLEPYIYCTSSSEDGCENGDGFDGHCVREEREEGDGVATEEGARIRMT